MVDVVDGEVDDEDFASELLLLFVVVAELFEFVVVELEFEEEL